MVKIPKFPVQRAWVRYLVEELRSHMQCNVAKKKNDLGIYRVGGEDLGPNSSSHFLALTLHQFFLICKMGHHGSYSWRAPSLMREIQ